MCVSRWGSPDGAVQGVLNTLLCTGSAGAGDKCTAGNTQDKRLVFYQVLMLVDILHVTPIEICRRHAGCK